MATFGLSVPLMFRGIFDTIRGSVPGVERELAKHENAFNSVVLIVWNLMPMAFQLMSMVFGYIRNKKIKKHKLEIKGKAQRGFDSSSFSD